MQSSVFKVESSTVYFISYYILIRSEYQMKMFVYSDDVKLEDLGAGVSRKVLAQNENMMVVEVHFETGAVWPYTQSLS